MEVKLVPPAHVVVDPQRFDRETFMERVGMNGAYGVPAELAQALLNSEVPVHFRTADHLRLPHGSTYGAAAARVLALQDGET